jgi:2-oxoglutarate ferredoxin oxidoreductase subunit alpha
LLVLGWGSTWGAINSAAERLRTNGHRVGYACLRHLNPFPRNLGDVLRNFERVVIPELNSGQLAMLIRARYLVDAVSYSKVTGKPFLISEIEVRCQELLGGDTKE